MYRVVRRILFLFPAEDVHYFSMTMLAILCKIPFARMMFGRPSVSRYPGLKKKVFGLTFNNPVGLAAGFDKNALYLEELKILGFSHIEIGTVTPNPQPGNDKPRLFRLPDDLALINRMGFNNDGVKIVAERLRKWQASGNYTSSSRSQKPIIGGNIGKNKNTPNKLAWQDYEICFRELFDCVDYFVVNVSSPNTPGLRELQEKESLQKILSHLQIINLQKPLPKPLLLKIAPDLTVSQIDDVIALSLEVKLDGILATNTTVSRENLYSSPPGKIIEIGNGGLSGKPLKKRSTEIVRYIYQKTQGKIPIIASGGVFTAEDVNEKLQAGASLVQVWTGFIYEGPFIVQKICRNL